MQNYGCFLNKQNVLLKSYQQNKSFPFWIIKFLIINDL